LVFCYRLFFSEGGQNFNSFPGVMFNESDNPPLFYTKEIGDTLLRLKQRAVLISWLRSFHSKDIDDFIDKVRRNKSAVILNSYPKRNRMLSTDLIVFENFANFTDEEIRLLKMEHVDISYLVSEESG